MTRLIAAVAVLGVGVACTNPPAPDTSGSLIERSHMTMGSELRLTAWTTNEAETRRAFEAVFTEFDRLDGLMSVWRDGSDIQQVNAAAGVAPVPVANEVREVLRLALEIGDLTGGKFDVTFAGLADVWKFDHDQDNRVPGKEEIAARLPLVNYKDLVLDESAGTVFLKRKGMRVNLGGIGKGYAVDRAATLLRSRSVANFMIQSGGDLYVQGARGDRAWRAGIQDPRGPAGQSFATLDLTGGTFSTSGDYERYFLKDGRRYHHILDPDTGEPAMSARSVTILADRAAVADALSTGVFVAGPDAGMRLIEQLPRVEGVIVTARNNLMVSSGLTRRLAVLAPPTDGP